MIFWSQNQSEHTHTHTHREIKIRMKSCTVHADVYKNVEIIVEVYMMLNTEKVPKTLSKTCT